jgi:DNA-binding MarR family transcriptional regulator
MQRSATPARQNPKISKRKARTPVMLTTDVLDNSLGYTLRRAQLSTFQEFTEYMASYDVRPAQFAVLVLIRANPGMTQSAIGGFLGIQKANFVNLLDRLADRGLTERRQVGGDRRSSALHLTKTGEAFVRKIEAAHETLEMRLSERLGERKSQQLLKLLREFCSKAPANAVLSENGLS